MRSQISGPALPRPVYAVIGAAAIAGAAAASATSGLARATRPLRRTVPHPPQVGDVGRMIAVLLAAVVRGVLDQIDLDALIRERIDVDGLVAGVVERMDLDAVAARLDVNAVADRVDPERVVARVDIDAVAARLDLDAIVDRLDVVGLAEEVINDIDLPEIIRESTGSLASQVVRDARIQSFDADEAVSQLVDRLLRRRRARSTEAPRPPGADSGPSSTTEFPP